MEININQLVDYCAKANPSFLDIYAVAVAPGKKKLGWRTQTDCSGLIFPLAGCARFTINQAPYVLEPGMVVHAGPDMGLDKEVLGDRDWRFAVVHYAIPEEAVIRFPEYQSHFSIQTGINPRITDLVEQLLTYDAAPDSLAILRSKMLFLCLLEETVLSAKRQQKNSDKELIQEAAKYLQENYGEPLSIEQVAARYDLTAKRFGYLFQKYIGMAPIRYLTEVRMRRSKNLLKTCECTIAQVAECVGYDSPYYFSHLFKQYTGSSPTAFREQSGKSI